MLYIKKMSIGGNKMKFFKGVLVGSMLIAGTTIMYKEGMFNKSKPFKKGKRFIKKIGII